MEGTGCYSEHLQNFLMSFRFALNLHEFRPNIVKVAVDPRGDNRVDPQTNSIMLRRNSLSITGETPEKLRSIWFLRLLPYCINYKFMCLSAY